MTADAVAIEEITELRNRCDLLEGVLSNVLRQLDDPREPFPAAMRPLRLLDAGMV